MLIRRQAWQHSLKQAYRDPMALLQALGFDRLLCQHLLSRHKDFPLLVPREFVARMKRNHLADPLLRQVLPFIEEDHPDQGLEDPLQEQPLTRSGIIKKYDGRALWVISGGCAVNCRYCFRRHFPYRAHIKHSSEWSEQLQPVAQDPSIHELILSGGDPLMLVDERLVRLLDEIEAIDSIQTLRIHTRLPVVIPSRVTSMLLEHLAQSRLNIIIVLHINHAQEVDSDVKAACHQLKAVSQALLNQSVLLKGVNDSADALVDLSHQLLSAGILPYYLHLFDPVKGAMHFSLPHQKSQSIMRALHQRLPGYLVPRCVRDVPGQPFKLPIEMLHSSL
jgi:EF-P beta-lysylation protein EpmB